MSGGAFRDASAALERVVALEQENEQLRSEIADLAQLRIEVEELAKLRTEVAELRVIARSENEGAYVKSLGEERDELAAEVRTLRDRLGAQERELAKARFAAKRDNALGGAIEPMLERMVNFFSPKK